MTGEQPRWTETVPRPYGKPYRARVQPRAILLGSHDDEEWEMWALRTHDLDVAVALLQATRFDLDVGTIGPPRTGWAVEHICFHQQEHASDFEHATPTTKGAFPIVTIEVEFR